MKAKQLSLTLVLLVGIAAAACQPARGTLEAMPVTATSGPSVESIHTTALAATEFTATTAARTATPPSATAMMVTRTATATPTAMPTENLGATATARVAAVIATVTPGQKEASTSPNGRWRAEVWRYECIFTAEEEETAYEELRLVDTHSGQAQVVDRQLQNCGGLGAAGLGHLAWSHNTRFLYFSTASEGVPDGGCGFWQRPLTAYELETGEMAELAQGPQAPGREVFAFWQWAGNDAPVELALWDQENGEAGRFPAVEHGWYRGAIAWSPDGSRMAFLETEGCYIPWGETLVAVVDPASGEITVLLRSEDPSMTSLEWTEPGSLTLFDENDQAWRLDLASGALSRR